MSDTELSVLPKPRQADILKRAIVNVNEAEARLNLVLSTIVGGSEVPDGAQLVSVNQETGELTFRVKASE